MAEERLVVPYLTYDRLGQLAEAFLAREHPSGTIPVPIEEIIDTNLHINIVPIPGLKAVLSDDGDDGIESFVTSSLTDIFVDVDEFDRQTNRYRFSLAHELAHIQLHQSIFSRLKVTSIADWKKAVRSIPEREYGWLEWQAYCFAGHLLVPTRNLVTVLAEVRQRANDNGLDVDDPAAQEARRQTRKPVMSLFPSAFSERVAKPGNQ